MALLFAFLFLVVGIPVLGIEWLYGKINKKRAELSSLRIVQWAFSTIIGICGTDVIVKGAENIPAEEAVVYVGNHRSIFDVVIGYTHCPGLTGFIAKDILRKSHSCAYGCAGFTAFFWIVPIPETVCV